jgi:hypothetical protein
MMMESDWRKILEKKKQRGATRDEVFFTTANSHYFVLWNAMTENRHAEPGGGQFQKTKNAKAIQVLKV